MAKDASSATREEAAPDPDSARDIQDPKDVLYGKKDSESEYPDVDEYINKKYADFSVHELQDELAKYTRSVGENNKTLGKLIPKKFAKFVNCKSVMERLWSEYTASRLTEQNTNKSVTLLLSRINSLIEKHEINLDDAKQVESETELTKEAMLMGYKEILRSNILNFSIFLETFDRCKKLFDEENRIDEIRPEIIDFLALIYERILRDGTTFEEACELAGTYLSVLSYQKDYTVEQKRSKIMNTVLVNFKDATHSRMKPSEEYYGYLFKSITKVLEYLKDEQAEEAIDHFFQMICGALSSTDPKYVRLVLKRVGDFIRSIDTPANNVREFKEGYSDLKVKLFGIFAAKTDLNGCAALFDVFLSVFKEKETKKAQDVLLRKVEKHLKNSNRHGFEYLNDQVKDINILANCLGSKASQNVRELEKRLKEKRDLELKEIVEKFRASFGCLKGRHAVPDGEISVLMKAVRIIDSSQEYHGEILSRCRDLIMKHAVILYFLHSYLKSDSPVLDANERVRVQELTAQFGFLLK